MAVKFLAMVMMVVRLVCVLLLVRPSVAAGSTASTALNLQLNYMAAPVVGVDTPVATFAWELSGPVRSATASQAYAEVTVVEVQTEAIVYASGKMATSQPMHTNLHVPMNLTSDAV